MSKKVYLATTKGCEACKIMNNILMSTYKDNLYTFTPEVLDFNELPDFIKINVPIGDFPLLVFVEDNVIKYHISGTTTKKKLQQIIKDINFN